MRGLKTKDVFAMSKILKKMNLKLEINGKTQEQIGGELILMIGENLHLAEKEVNEFMGDLVGMTEKEFAELPIEETLKHMNEFKSMPGIKDFFKSAGQLMKQKS